MGKIRSVARFRIHPGKTEEFKRLSAECMRLAHEKDTGTLQYEIFLSPDETECVVYEEYVDSAASIAHFEHMGDNAAAIFRIVDATGELWGEPSSDLRKAVEAHDVKIFSPFLSFSDAG